MTVIASQPVPDQASVTDLVDDLIRRSRKVANPDYNQHWTTRFPDVSDEQLLTGIEVYLVQNQLKQNIRPSYGTTVSCTRCGRLDASAYYLKHSHGKYALLCFDGGNGCWERSAHSNCSYVDPHTTQCLDLAEWVVAYGQDMLKERHVCSMHVAAVLSDVSEHRVFALED